MDAYNKQLSEVKQFFRLFNLKIIDKKCLQLTYCIHCDCVAILTKIKIANFITLVADEFIILLFTIILLVFSLIVV